MILYIFCNKYRNYSCVDFVQYCVCKIIIFTADACTLYMICIAKYILWTNIAVHYRSDLVECVKLFWHSVYLCLMVHCILKELLFQKM